MTESKVVFHHSRAGVPEIAGDGSKFLPFAFCQDSGRPACGHDSAFTIVELLIVIAVVAVIAAIALPSATSALQGYRLNSDAGAIANVLNVARMKAASQYAPYRLNIYTDTGTYTLEKLCGSTPSTSDANCTSRYNSFTTPQIDPAFGTQNIAQGDTYLACHPSSVTAYPSSVTADPTGCPGAGPNPIQIYFNTRGSPVDNTGSPLATGVVLYITNQNSLVDAVTVSIGGRAAVWTWSPGSSLWSMR